MRVLYERPRLETKFEVTDDFNFLKVGSADDARRMQEQLFEIADNAANFLRGYELPNIDGEVSVTFEGYNAKREKRFIGLKTVGVVGFPAISIQTDLGNSSISLHPRQDSMIYHIPGHPYRNYGNHIEIGVNGVGLVDKVVQELLPDVESAFAIGPLKVETFGNHQPAGLLSKKYMFLFK